MVRHKPTSKAQVISAHAKTNLNLRVHRKRKDGFHEVSTRMARISLADELRIRSQEEGGVHFTCSDASLPTDESNLVINAIRRFENATSNTVHARVHLEKRIPHGAGLGGGSSDAASMLLALQKQFGEPLSTSELHALAAELGSDVPFFLENSTCDCGDRGVDLTPVPFDWKLPIILLKPDFPVSAGWAYEHWADSKPLPGVSYLPQICPWGEMVNDLERPVFEKHLVLAEMKSWLLGQPEVHSALMSGSGSTMLAILKHVHFGYPLAERAEKHFGASLWTFVGHTI